MCQARKTDAYQPELFPALSAAIMPWPMGLHYFGHVVMYFQAKICR